MFSLNLSLACEREKIRLHHDQAHTHTLKYKNTKRFCYWLLCMSSLLISIAITATTSLCTVYVNHCIFSRVKSSHYYMQFFIRALYIQWILLYWSTSVQEYFGPIKRQTQLSELWLIHYHTFVFGKVNQLGGWPV